MKLIKQNSFFYYVFCICSLGLAWWIRVIITEGIKQALENE